MCGHPYIYFMLFLKRNSKLKISYKTSKSHLFYLLIESVSRKIALILKV